MPGKLKRVIRLDSQPLSQTFFTSEGYLMDRPILTSTGIFEYVNPDGSIRRELRLPEDVFDPESLKSYRGKPIIVTHDAGLITKDNVAENTIGTILSEGYRSGNDVRAEIVIHNADELKDCGYRELSLGYNLDLDETPGIYEGEPYDAIQRNIRINHLALVDEARAGEQARLNIDGRDTALKGGKLVKKTKTRKRTNRKDGMKKKFSARRTTTAKGNSARRNDGKKTGTAKRKAARRADGILTPDELRIAIEEYKAHRAAFPHSNVDDEELELAAQIASEEAPEHGDDETAEDVVMEISIDPEELEEQLQLIQDRRDRRDEEDDPSNLREAKGLINEQDKDIGILFDIIDTLLAQIVFDEGEDEESNEDGDGEESNSEEFSEDDEDAESNEDDDDEELCEDDDDMESNEDDDDEEFSEDDEDAESNEDDDDEELCEDDEDDEIPSTTETDVVLNADSIDRIVRERVKIAKAASMLNMDGLESIKPMKAKRTIIRAVKPGIRLDGKSTAYINAMFDLTCQELQKRSRKDTMYQRKQMFNKDGRRASGNPTEAKRQKMIRRLQKSK